MPIFPFFLELMKINIPGSTKAIDRAALPDLMNYWGTGANVTGVHELVGNALILPGEKERETDLRGEPLPGMEDEADE